MNTTHIFSHISQHITWSDSDRDLLGGHLRHHKVTKNQFLLRQGDLCPDIYFINSGVLRAYHISPDGKESTVMFATDGWWITDMYCFLNELPAHVSIQAVERSELLSLTRTALESLYEEIPAFNKFFRILMQNAYCREQLRMIQNLSLPAADRYESFMKKYPQIATKVPLKQIATYLGITPEFLSTIRAKK